MNRAELGSSIDRAQARLEYEKAEERLNIADNSGDRQEKIQATKALKRARARLQASGGLVN